METKMLSICFAVFPVWADKTTLEYPSYAGIIFDDGIDIALLNYLERGGYIPPMPHSFNSLSLFVYMFPAMLK